MVWIQYNLSDGQQTGTNSQKVDDDALTAIGRAQIECPDGMGDPTQYNVDITQNPSVLINIQS